MTATIVYLQPEAVHLLTDGAMFAPDGAFVALKQKVQIAAHQSAAYAARGPDMYSGLLSVVMSQAQGDFDRLVTEFAGMCTTAHAAMLAAVKSGTPVPGDPAMVDAVLIGHSLARGFCAFAVSSYPEEGHPAWTLRPLGGAAPLAYVSPMDSMLEVNLRMQRVNLWDGSPDVEKHGLAIMREQRSTGIVGGFCQITSILPSGVFSRVLERWPMAPEN